MWTLLFVTVAPAAFAIGPEASDAGWTGSWTLSDAPTVVQQRVEAAVDAALAGFASPIRFIARPRLVAASTFCTQYRTERTATTWTIQCDSTASVTVTFGQPPAPGVAADGRPYAVSVRRDGDRLELEFRGEEGWQRTRYQPGADGCLNVEKTLHSTRLGTDVTWTMAYTRG